jgi:hypothetical protein
MTGVVIGPAASILQNVGGLFEIVVPNACQVTIICAARPESTVDNHSMTTAVQDSRELILFILKTLNMAPLEPPSAKAGGRGALLEGVT